MLLQKYENLLQTLNTQINNWDFNVEKNKNTLEKIIEIYKELKIKNYEKVKILIHNLEWIEWKIMLNEKKDNLWSISPWCPMPSPCVVMESDNEQSKKISKKSLSQTRDWDTQINLEDDNIEAFNSIEMMSAIFLQNIKDKIWIQK